MTTDICGEDVIVRLSSPRIIPSDSLESNAQPGARAAASSLELGRRLLLAARAGDTATVLDLMAKGAPFTTDWLGTSPLHLAAANNHVETCSVLLRAGVSRDSRTKVERTPLHLAAHSGHAAVVTLLLQHGAIPDCRDMLKMTPLHWAAAKGHSAVVAELLRRGADMKAKCKFRKTARCLAIKYRRRDVIALLDAAEAAQAAQTAQSATDDDKVQEFASLQKMQDIKPIVQAKVKINPEKTIIIESKTEPINISKSTNTTGAPSTTVDAGSVPSRAEGAALLRAHGITLLPADRGCTVLTALRSGRTVVLSDAGKLMLKESSNESNENQMLLDDTITNSSASDHSANNTITDIDMSDTNIVNNNSAVNNSVVNNIVSGNSVATNISNISGLGVLGGIGGPGGKNVLVRARAVRSVRAGKPVKLVTLNKSDQMVKKIINSSDLQKVKLVQVANSNNDNKLRQRPALKLLLNKANLSRLLATTKSTSSPTLLPIASSIASSTSTPIISINNVSTCSSIVTINNVSTSPSTSTSTCLSMPVVTPTSASTITLSSLQTTPTPDPPDPMETDPLTISPENMVRIPEQFIKSSSVKYLRSQLLAAHAAIANLAAELKTCKAKLAKYEENT